MPARDAIAELQPGQDARRDALPTTTTAATDWSGWERWLHTHLDNALGGLHRALGQLLAAERRKFADQLERKTHALELEIAKLTNSIVVLPPSPAKFPSVKAWKEGVHYKGDVVAFVGSCYQAQCDTAQLPGTSDWTCLAVAGAGFTARGKYLAGEAYQRGDVVMLDGASFVALRSAPGVCPGDDWRLLAMRGARGRQGLSGARGVMGLRGERGEATPGIQSWSVNRERYTATPIMTDGSIGPTLNLRRLVRAVPLGDQQWVTSSYPRRRWTSS